MGAAGPGKGWGSATAYLSNRGKYRFWTLQRVNITCTRWLWNVINMEKEGIIPGEKGRGRGMRSMPLGNEMGGTFISAAF